jgi:hypothetical protein
LDSKTLAQTQTQKATTLAGEKDLDNLLRSMAPHLTDGEFVFCTLKEARYGDLAIAKPIASFAEKEGLSLVVLKEDANKLGLDYEGVFRCITLGVHSSLEAVGLTAAVSACLTEHGISANIIAAHFHDHVFVQSEMADRAIHVLSEFNK